MILSDRTLRQALADGRIGIDPLGDHAIQPSSIDLRIDSQFRVFANHRYPFIDVRENQEDLTELLEVDDGEPFMLHPGEFVLGATLEKVTVPHDLVGALEGKSSLGRLGLVIHATASVVDPGFSGYLTLELSNAATLPIAIYPRMKIGQLTFFELDGPAEHPYGSDETGSKYQGQRGPTASRYYLNFRPRER